MLTGLAFLLITVVVSWGCARRGSPIDPNDGTEPSGYRLVATFPIVGYAEDLDIADGVAVVAASQGGIVVLDVSNPADPTFLGSRETERQATGCWYSPADSIALVATGGSGIRAFDLSDPSSPTEFEFMQATRSRDVIAVEVTPGELFYVYVADGEGDFRIGELQYFEQWDLWSLNQIHHPRPDGNARGLCIDGDLVFLAMEEVGIAIYDVSALPDEPPLRGAVDTPGEARGVTVAGDHAYVADWRAGLQVIDVSNPDEPVLVGSAETVGNAVGVAWHDDKAYVADHTGGLRVFDVSDPTDPTPYGYLDTPYANGVFVTDSHVYVADRDWGIVVVEEDE